MSQSEQYLQLHPAKKSNTDPFCTYIRPESVGSGVQAEVLSLFSQSSPAAGVKEEAVKGVDIAFCHQYPPLPQMQLESWKDSSKESWLLQVIRIQPDEAIYLKINNKIPGLGLRLDTSKLDLTYKSRYNTHLPDAYERLILDVINGDKRLFIRNDELEAAWALFTPILQVKPPIQGYQNPFSNPTSQGIRGHVK